MRLQNTGISTNDSGDELNDKTSEATISERNKKITDGHFKYFRISLGIIFLTFHGNTFLFLDLFLSFYIPSMVLRNDFQIIAFMNHSCDFLLVLNHVL